MLSAKQIHRVLIVAAALVLIALAACAPLKPEFSHQGRLLDGSGDPVPDGDYPVVYKFYHAASGGTAVYETAEQTVAVVDGLFTITVGASPEDINPEIFSEPTWLEVVVNGETLAPRHKLLGAPYAFSMVPGSVVQGPETIDRTFLGFTNTGAAFSVSNSDATATGGNGLVVVNQAAAVGDNRNLVAALQAIAGGGVNDDTTQTGAYGAIINSESYRGLYAKGSSGPIFNFFAAVFDSESGITIINGGVCTGCAMAFFAKNSDGQAIEEGAFVTVAGVEVDPDLNVPVMLVRPVSSASDQVVGVANGALTRTPVGDFYGTKTGGFDPMNGPAESGGYLSVVVSGLVQIQVGQASSLNIGDRIALDEGQVTLAGAQQDGVARLLSDVDSDGFAWILFNGQ